jgi:hypothetical protein
MLAQPIVVSGSTQPIGRPSTLSPPLLRPVVTEQGEEVSSGSEDSALTRVAIVRRALRDKGFSESTAACISQPQRQSTLAIYESKWKRFTSWCKQWKIDPLTPTVPQVADFLLQLSSVHHFKPRTIDGYRTAISNTIKSVSDRDLGHDPHLTALIVRLYQECPVVRPIPVDWDLSLVLRVLNCPPFEPLRLAKLKWLTFKTLFLVAFASARRRGELHALIVDRIAHTGLDVWKSVTIFSDPTFLSKTHVPTRGTGIPPLVIPALSQSDALEFDTDGALQCPVRAVKIYVERSASYRRMRRKLFISHALNHEGEIAPATISSWIRDTIIQCYKLSNNRLRTEYKVTAHSVRSMATSWAVTNRATVADVMTAAMWRAPTTFTSFYLRDVTNISDSMYRIGPVVAALNVI